MPNSTRRAADPDSAPDTVRLRGVGFGYADRPGVLRDVNLSLPQGSFHFLTGPSGAGKSSLLRLLTLAERPQTGRISLFGRNVTDLPRGGVPAFRRRMGVVFQDFRLLENRSVYENVAYAMEIIGKSERQIRKRVPLALDMVGLSHRMKKLELLAQTMRERMEQEETK